MSENKLSTILDLDSTILDLDSTIPDLDSTILDLNSTILDFDWGNPMEIQNMSLPAINTTMPTPSGMQDNHYSVQLPVKETKSQNPQHISCPSVQPNKENVGSKNFSPISVLQTKNRIEIPLPTVQQQLSGGQSIVSRYRLFLSSMLKEATMLSTFALKSNEEKSKKDQNLLFLEVMKSIKNWLDQIAELNKFYTERYQDLIFVVMRCNGLEEIVNYKMKCLSTRISLSNLSVYESMHLRGKNLLSTLRRYKTLLDENLIAYSQYRETYLNGSIQVSAYPFEEKLFEKGVNVLKLINNISMVLNNLSSKLVRENVHIVFLFLELENLVTSYCHDIEVALS